MNLERRIRPTLRERAAFALQTPCDWLLRASCATYPTFLGVFKLMPSAYLAWASKVKARRAYYRAIRQVPAYGEFLGTRPGTRIP
ncbi:MAG TPA: hypothetical protein VII52_05460, partial [Gemmatimonadaceae bacterium]